MHAIAGISLKRAVACVAAALVAATFLGAAPPAAAQEELKDVEDSKIVQAVDTALLFDEAVAAHLVDVASRDGVVTLTGTVDNALARDRAAKIARMTRGVRSVVNQIEVAPPEVPDDALETDVLAALAADPATDSYELTVRAADGDVTLTGEVESWAEKELAATVAKGVRGVSSVENAIDVDYQAERLDPEIQAEVERRLENDVLVDAELIDVSVDDAEVTLEGTVGSAEEKLQARTDAWVAGVENVDAEDLEVEWWARDEMRRPDQYLDISDKKIADAVQEALLYDPRVLSFNPEVEVENGVVTLTGRVDNLSAKQAAARAARNTVGVWKVRNLLRVRPQERPTDSELAERVTEMLEIDPYAERSEITATVVNGQVFLSGAVDTRFERQHAEELAEAVNGVVAVSNNLKIDDQISTFKTDYDIRTDVRNQLLWSPYVDADDVSVTVVDGEATLSGTVDTWFERRKAEENAWEAGPEDVVNNLTVRYLPASQYPEIYSAW